MSVALWWVRRDLRLADNPALAAALAHPAVIPVFVLDPGVLETRWHRRALARQAFLFEGLRALDTALRARGSRLVVAAGRPADVLPALVAATGASAVHAVEDFSPYARRRDDALARMLPLRLTAGLVVNPPTQVLTRQQGPYTVFTPYYRAWRALPAPAAADCLPAPAHIPGPVRWPDSLPIPPGAPAAGFPAGETEAARRLARFVAGPIDQYATHRDLPALAGTSALSPYLRFGMLSPRVAVVAALAAVARGSAGAETWLKELVWREFYLAVLHHFPHVLRMAFNPRLRAIRWRDAPSDLAAWQQGQTGYPIVDACMRQLAATGWMHNRGRMIVASFLAKDLLLDWRLGEQWFMEQLLDGDPAANNGGWQWAAGVGTDAAPYFRIFNPVLQGEKFDPDGTFVRRFVPELAGLPTRFLHRPWTMPALERERCGVKLGETYPHPIVDHAIVKARTLAAYQAAQRAT